MLEQNKKSWNKVAHHFNGKDALPSYGPYTQTEEELRLFDDVEDKKVLDIGCGSGHSLRYLAEKGAGELWGVDLSSAQIDTAKRTLEGLNANLHCAPMEVDVGIPKDYFDVVCSIYAIGWTTDLPTTYNMIHSYMKPGGSFIFSWDHPLYPFLKSENGTLTFAGSYQDEGTTTYRHFKGEDAPVSIPNRKLATYVNELIKAGFVIESIVESDVSAAFDSDDEDVSDRYYSLHKAKRFPTTMIIKARKPF
ncbi:class I SAM-dependent methyltransferase [Rossellomorea aquimaris]|uniref:class I SAM-dependent methyltransferase n=1 Tax=Rossellomorea aquimaris TaxID=189382 RepID=UPI0021E5DD60